MGQLTRLNGRFVLDVSPEPLAVHVSDLYRDLLRPLHTFFFLDFRGELLVVSMPNPDSLRNHLLTNPGALARTSRSDDLLLTTPTTELREFLASMSLRPGVVDSVTYWRRP